MGFLLEIVYRLDEFRVLEHKSTGRRQTSEGIAFVEHSALPISTDMSSDRTNKFCFYIFSSPRRTHRRLFQVCLGGRKSPGSLLLIFTIKRIITIVNRCCIKREKNVKDDIISNTKVCSSSYLKKSRVECLDKSKITFAFF